MKQYIFFISAVVVAFFLGWYCGYTSAQLKFSIKEKRKIENVAYKRAKIYSAPNADRDALLELMRAGKL